MVEFTYAPTTGLTPSFFGMPACGHAPVMAAVTPAQSRLLATSVVRERQAAMGVTVNAGIKGGVDFVQTRIPGTPAWRPPSSS